jgi:pyrimidine nucleoside transport protein
MSEVHAVIASGFATIAGNVFALYVSLGIDATFLLAASVMSAPAALAYAKLLYPEKEESQVSFFFGFCHFIFFIVSIISDYIKKH